MIRKNQGFSLIELVMVIVIIGILSAVAIPKFIDLEGSARQAATDGIAGALGAGSAINYASRSAGNTADTTAVTNCTSVANTLQGGLDGNYTITAGAIANGTTASCTVTRVSGETANFVGHGIN